MMNNNTFYDNSASVIPAGYETIEPEKKDPKKAIIITAIVIFLLVIAAIVVAVIVIDKNSNGTNGQDAEHIEYDHSNDDTGGEEVDVPNNQSLNFLKLQQISDEDIKTIEYRIRETLDQYYADTGYDSIIYDISSVNKSASTNIVSFIFRTDRADMYYRASIKLNDDNQIVDIFIVQDETLGK